MPEKSDIIFNISGGVNQILPNATEARQVFVGDQFASDYLHPATEVPEEAASLRAYINNVEVLTGYLSQLGACTSATDVARVVVNMALDEDAPRVTADEIKRERFISTLLPLIPKVESGLTVGNLRARINDAWASRPRKMRQP